MCIGGSLIFGEDVHSLSFTGSDLSSTLPILITLLCTHTALSLASRELVWTHDLCVVFSRKYS